MTSELKEARQPIQRSVSTKRLYSLGSFQNIEFYDSITGLPEEVAFDEEFLRTVGLLQILRVEQQLNRYYLLRDRLRERTPEEVIEILEELKAKEQEKLFGIIETKLK